VSEAAVRLALAEVMDPELPVLSIVDLGIVHRVAVRPDGIASVSGSRGQSGGPKKRTPETCQRDSADTAGDIEAQEEAGQPETQHRRGHRDEDRRREDRALAVVH